MPSAADVVEPAEERRHDVGADLGGQDRLRRREHQRHVDPDAVVGQSRAGLEARRASSAPSRRRSSPFCGQADALLVHRVGRGLGRLERDVAVDLRRGSPSRSRSGSSCSFATSGGFVVTPVSTPQRLISRISSMLAGVEEQPHRVLPFVVSRVVAPRARSCVPRRSRRAFHDQVDHRGDRLVEAVVGDHRHPVRRAPGSSRSAAAGGCSSNPSAYRCAGREATASSRAREVRAVPLLVVDRDHERDREDPAHRTRPTSKNPGTTCAPSITMLVPSSAARSISALIPTATAAVCSRNPTIRASAGLGRRLAQRRVGLERRRVERGHQLGREHRPHDLADRVGGDHPDDAQARGQLRRDRRLADAGGAADQDHERHVQLLDLAPPHEVLRVALARELAQTPRAPSRASSSVVSETLAPRSRSRSSTSSATWYARNGDSPVTMTWEAMQPLGERQPRLAIGDHDVGVFGSFSSPVPSPVGCRVAVRRARSRDLDARRRRASRSVVVPRPRSPGCPRTRPPPHVPTPARTPRRRQRPSVP